jgi:ribosomal protein S18 acetylase RimI-like enzyme
MIVNLQKSDISEVVRIHMEELPGFLTKLGKGFLNKYYIYSLNIPEIFTIVEKQNGEIAGFATGSTSISNLNRKIIFKDFFGFGYEVLKYVFTHISETGKIVQAFTYPGFNKDVPELLTIAIGKKYQRKGIGRKLFRVIAETFNKREKTKFLVSVYDRLPANGFYLKMGCRKHKSFDFLGEKMNYYEYTIK